MAMNVMMYHAAFTYRCNRTNTPGCSQPLFMERYGEFGAHARIAQTSEKGNQNDVGFVSCKGGLHPMTYSELTVFCKALGNVFPLFFHWRYKRASCRQISQGACKIFVHRCILTLIFELKNSQNNCYRRFTGPRPVPMGLRIP